MEKKIKKLVELYGQFIEQLDMSKLIKEVTIARNDAGDVDDGPGTWYKKWDHYQKDVVKKAEQHGWKIIDYILNGKENIIKGPSLQVTYFPAGVVGKGTPTNYKDLKGKKASRAWLKDIRTTSLSLGFKFMDWLETLEDIKNAEKASREDFKDQKEHEKETKKIEKSVQQESKLFNKDWWIKELLF